MNINKTKPSILQDIIYTERTGTFLIVISAIVFIFAIIVFVTCGSWQFSTILDETKVGTFGDFIGGVVGTLLAFVASILYYVALKEQRKELSQNHEAIRLQTEALNQQIEEFEAQKKELELSREVYSKQCEIMKEEERTMHIQQFDSHFFGMLQMYRDIKNSLCSNSEGNDFFQNLIYTIKDNSLTTTRDYGELKKIVQGHYIKVFTSHQNILSPYFRCLYRLIRQIDDNEFLSDEEKWRYVKLVRAQLSDFELLVLYYNCCTTEAEKALLLYYKYNLFKHLQVSKKIEFIISTGIDEIQSNIIQSISQWLYPNIEMFTNKVCESNLDEDIVLEFRNEHLDLIFKCSSSIDNITIEVVLPHPDILPNNIKLVVFNLLIDKLFYSRFVDLGIPIRCRDLKDQDSGEVHLEYIFDGCLINNLNEDKY